MAFDAQNVISGKEGRLFLDGVQVAWVKQFDATVTKKKTPVDVVGELWESQKTIGLSGAGTLTLYKVTSDFINQVANFANGAADVFFTLQGVLDDQSAGLGTERVTLYNCNIDSVKVGQLDASGNILEEQIPFTFKKYDVTNSLTGPQ